MSTNSSAPQKRQGRRKSLKSLGLRRMRGRNGNSSWGSRGNTQSGLRIPPASSSNHSRDGVNLLSSYVHRTSACRGSAKSPAPLGGDSGPGPGLSRWGIPDDGLRLYSPPPPSQKTEVFMPFKVNQ